MLRKKVMSEAKSNNGVYEINIEQTLVPERVITMLMSDIADEMNIDLRKAKRKMIFETHEISVEDANKYFIPKGFYVYCLGMPNETKESLIKAIKLNDDKDDWTANVGTFMLEMTCNQIICRSKEMQKECRKYGIKFFDTSGNRKEKINKIIEQIETISVK